MSWRACKRPSYSSDMSFVSCSMLFMTKSEALQEANHRHEDLARQGGEVQRLQAPTQVLSLIFFIHFISFLRG